MRQTARLVALLLAAATAALTAAASNPFGFLATDVVIDRTDLAALQRGEPVIKLSNGDNDHLGVFAAIRIEASGERLLDWASAIEVTLKGRYVPEIGRFSSPARLEDLAGLTFDYSDLDEIRDCRPGDCGLKLSDGDIARLRSTIAISNWENQAREELRRIVLERARAYQSGGDAYTPPYHDADEPVSPALSFGRLLNRLQLLPPELTCVATFVRGYPRLVDSHVVDSFLYWSKESLGSKPIIAITHLTLARFQQPWLPEAVVIGKQVFASHYKNGALTLMAIVRADQARYLVYLQHAELDVFRGFWHDVVRMVLERRITREAPRVLLGFRDRLEAGGPRMTDRPAATVR